MDEAYGIWEGLKQLETLGVDEAIVLGYSHLIIQAMNGTSHFKNLRLFRLLKRIHSISRNFRHLEFVHILYELNLKVDQTANKVIKLHTNNLYVNYQFFPALPP